MSAAGKRSEHLEHVIAWTGLGGQSPLWGWSQGATFESSATAMPIASAKSWRNAVSKFRTLHPGLPGPWRLQRRARLCYKESMDDPIGKVSHYFGHIGVAAVQLTGPLAVGDRVHVKGHTTDFTQTIDSLEVEHQKVSNAGSGDEVAFKVTDKARIGDQVFRVRTD